MHEIIFYEDAAGNKPVLEFIQELRSKNGKDARIRVNKVLEYIKVLETSGTAAGEPYTKHLDGECINVLFWHKLPKPPTRECGAKMNGGADDE